MRWIVIGVVVLTGCSGVGSANTTEPPFPETTAPGDATTTTSSTVPPGECPPPPYDLTFVPAGVGEGEIDTTVEPDVWTSVPGTNTIFVPRSDDTIAIALIRGTLPAVDWPAEKGEISIDGTRAAVGPHPDGTWVAGWYEEPAERCDLYTMVFYPPWNPSDVEDVLLGMNRVGG